MIEWAPSQPKIIGASMICSSPFLLTPLIPTGLPFLYIKSLTLKPSRISVTSFAFLNKK